MQLSLNWQVQAGALLLTLSAKLGATSFIAALLVDVTQPSRQRAFSKLMIPTDFLKESPLCSCLPRLNFRRVPILEENHETASPEPKGPGFNSRVALKHPGHYLL